MQKKGTVICWDATRAFGFIRSPDTSADVFFHVRDYRGSAAPREGLAVLYEEIHVGGKGPRAMAQCSLQRRLRAQRARPARDLPQLPQPPHNARVTKPGRPLHTACAPHQHTRPVPRQGPPHS